MKALVFLTITSENYKEAKVSFKRDLNFPLLGALGVPIYYKVTWFAGSQEKIITLWLVSRTKNCQNCVPAIKWSTRLYFWLKLAVGKKLVIRWKLVICYPKHKEASTQNWILKWIISYGTETVLPLENMSESILIITKVNSWV